MTLIECFNNALVENVAVCLELKPDKLILLGNEEELEDIKTRYNALFEERKLSVEIKTEPIGDDRLSDITKLLAEIICQEGECVIDLTDADEIPAMAVGATLMQLEPSLRRKVCVQKYDPQTDTITTLMGTPSPAMPGAELTVKELVALFGGIVYPNSYQPPMNYTPLQLEGLWQTMRAFTPKKWNRMLTNLAEFESRSKDKMHIRVDLDSLREEIGEFDEKLGRVQTLLNALREKGVVLYRKDDHILDYKYTDPLYRYCTQKAGNTLEIKVLLEARSLKEQGCSFFTDCQTSVHIDWDGHVHKISDNIPDTNNEIDLILMHGVTPLFISCKNGDVEEEELYKLHTVAREFGGPNVRKMLVATSLSKHDPSHKALIRRAWDMDIYPVTGFTKFTSEDWQDTFRDALW